MVNLSDNREISYIHTVFQESFSNILLDGEKYTLCCHCKLNDDYITEIEESEKNNRISIKQGQEEVLGTRCDEIGIPQIIYVTFTYDETKPLEIFIYLQHMDIDLTNIMEIYGFQIYKGYYKANVYEKPVLDFDDVSLLVKDIKYAKGKINPNSSTSNYNFQKIPFGDLVENKNIIVRGMGVCFDYSSDNEIIVDAQIATSSKTSKRNSILKPENKFILIGDLTDKWGLRSNEIDLSNLSFDLKFINASVRNQEFYIKNVCFILFYELDRTAGSLGFRYNDEHCSEYGIFMHPSPKVPGGPNSKVEKLSLSGGAGELITGTTIESKDIEIEFDIDSDTIEETEKIWKKAVRWLNAGRDKTLIPKQNELIFDSDPDIVYYSVLEGSVEKSDTISTIEGKAKFIVSDGVGYSRNLKVTGPADSNNGSIVVYPVLNVYCTGGPVIIKESVNGQLMEIREDFNAGTSLTINCGLRTIVDGNGKNYQNKVTFKSKWFGLINDYNFTNGQNCIVERVIYQEGE